MIATKAQVAAIATTRVISKGSESSDVVTAPTAVATKANTATTQRARAAHCLMLELGGRAADDQQGADPEGPGDHAARVLPTVGGCEVSSQGVMPPSAEQSGGSRWAGR
ncbi:hypothetical protein [Rhodococcus sp. ACS1]|uniref:hypothetical protein n=1 Tax=Rhodococcus sp. ACS1 TaxID=2028570 RepID=UPI000A62B307